MRFFSSCFCCLKILGLLPLHYTNFPLYITTLQNKFTNYIFFLSEDTLNVTIALNQFSCILLPYIFSITPIFAIVFYFFNHFLGNRINT